MIDLFLFACGYLADRSVKGKVEAVANVVLDQTGVFQKKNFRVHVSP